ncbi:MAG: GH92 family glycosyl hydrolase, partial [Bifidobacteriaceae bacterium]|nr:GH92 family glycosyl hydrolase [Bifidobacteriaceae bacterium]
MTKAKLMKRVVGLVGTTALAVGVVQALPAAADPVPVPGGTWATSFEAADPAPTVSPDSPPTNVTGRKVSPGDLSEFIDLANVAYSSQYNTSESAIKAFDGDPTTKWLANNSGTKWITIPLTTPKRVANYTLIGANDDIGNPSRIPRAWTFDGSNDPLCQTSPTTADWINLDTQADQNEVTVNFQVRPRTITFTETNDAAYLCFRLVTTTSSGNMMQLGEVQISDGSTEPPPATPPTTEIGNGPSAGYNIKANMGWTGSKAFHLAGAHVDDGDAGAAYTLYTGLNVPIGSATELSYMLIPKLYPSDLTYPSQFTAIDLEYIDPSDPATPHRLSESGIVDQYGFGVSAREQGLAKKMWSNHWNRIAIDLSPLAGMTVTKIVLVYDNPTGNADTAFEAWLDDVTIEDAVPINESSLVNYVDTRRGTLSSGSFSRGLNFPAAAMPNGFNFYTPATDATGTGSMYAYAAANNSDNRPVLNSFRISHAPSNWMGDYLYTKVFPGVASSGTAVFNASTTARALSFSHDNEIARPDLYEVEFDNGLVASIAPEDHGAVFKFKYPLAATYGSILFDTGSSTNSTTNAAGGNYTLDAATGEVTGWDGANYNGWTAGGGRLYIYAKFSEPVVAGGTGTSRTSSKYANFNLGSTDTVEVRVATSFISIDQAKRNYELELEGRSFEDVRQGAEDAWNDRLDVIDMSDTETNDIHKVMVYSDLYRLNLYPNARHENTGTNAVPEWKYASPVTYPAQTSGTSGSVLSETNQQVLSGKMYVNNGFWDTYRTAWPMYAMLYPEMSSELVDGFAEQYRAGGWIARWSSPGYADLMTGTSSDSAFAEAYNVGMMDGRTALDTWFAAERNATAGPQAPYTGKAASTVGRKGFGQAPFLGWTPATTDQSASWGLEGFINDHAQAKMATKMLEDPEVLAVATPAELEQIEQTGKYLDRRTDNFINQFDSREGGMLFAPRNANGTWANATPWNKVRWGNGYTETSGWNFNYHVGYDVEGLATLFGGRQGLLDDLDAFFATPEDASSSGIHEAYEARDVRFGQWSASNQVSFHIPWVYAEAGRPASTQAITKEAAGRLFVGSDIGQGYAGDEDNGATSSWYLFAMMGFYPLNVGDSYYTIGSPFFDTITIDRGTHGKITINGGDENKLDQWEDHKYVAGVSLDGEELTEPRLDKEAFLADGDHVLDFELSSTPTTWGSDDSVIGADSEPSPLVDVTSPKFGALEASDGASVATLIDNNSSTARDLTGPEDVLTWTSTSGIAYFTQYTITSSADTTADLPTDWVVEGSTDGSTWVVLDERSGQEFKWPTQTRAYTMENPGAFNRLRISFANDLPIRLSELEFLADTTYVPEGVTFYPAPASEITFGKATNVFLGRVRAPSNALTDYAVSIDLRDGAGARDVTVVKGELGGVDISLDGITIPTAGLYSALITVAYTGNDPTNPLTLYAEYPIQVGGTRDITSAFDAVCITELGATGVACDGQGWGFARSQLGYGDTMAWTVGATVTIPDKIGPGPGTGNNAISEQEINAAGMRAYLPDVAIGQPDAVTEAGARIPLVLGENATKIAFIGTSNEGAHGGNGKIIYADGFEQTAYVGFADWCFSGSSPAEGTQVLSSVQTRINGSGVQEGSDKTTSIFITDPIALVPGHGAAVAYIMPPYNSNDAGTLVGGRVHIMAVASDGDGELNPAAAAPTSTSRDAVTVAHANQRITLGTAEGGSAALSVTINWGDSSLLDSGEIIDGQVTGQHTYGAPGTYTVTYTLTDGVNTTVSTVTVTAPSAMVELTTQTRVVIAGATAIFSGEGFTPGETVEAVLDLSPAATQRVTADSTGGVDFTFAVPATTPEGVYSVVASGVRSARVGTATLTVLPLKKSANLTVTAAPATVEILSSTTLTARIDTHVAGQIEFLADGETLDLLTPDSSGQAILTTSALNVGSHKITARYAGDTLTNAAVSAPVAVTVVKPVFTPSLTLTPGATVIHDQALTFAGSGFSAGEAVTVRIVGTAVSTVVVAGTDGGFTVALPVTKALAAGTYTVEVSGDYSETPVRQTVTVAKKAVVGTVVPPTGDAPEPGGVFAFSGSGFEPGETVTVTITGTNASATGVAGAAGSVTVNVPVPASLAPGAHAYAVEGSYSGPVAGGGTMTVAKSAIGLTVLVGA